MNSESYYDGWHEAQDDWNELIPYDANRWPDDRDDVETEDFIQGYYDFWKEKGFSLDDRN